MAIIYALINTIQYCIYPWIYCMGKFCSKNLVMFIQTRIVGMFKMQDEHNLSLRQAFMGPGKTIMYRNRR